MAKRGQQPSSLARAEIACPRCGTVFAPKRANQQYCRAACSKAATRNAKRGSQKIEDSPEARRRQEERTGRMSRLSHAFYETPSAYRSAFIVRLIEQGRAERELRGLLSKRERVSSWARDHGTGRLHIAHVLDHFCQEVYRARSWDVLNPRTVLPGQDGVAFPSHYFGPDAEPIYEDGCLVLRPCPWAEHRRNRPSSFIKGSRKDRSGGYDWRRIAWTMQDHGWQSYYTDRELDDMGEYRPEDLEDRTLLASYPDLLDPGDLPEAA